MSLRRAAALGVRWVEFDVRLSGDRRPILFHDTTLRRTTNGSGRVSRTSFGQIRTLDAGSWFGASYAGELVPTLAEAVALLGRLDLGANIEIKPEKGHAEETAAIVIAELKRHWRSSRQLPLISSFDWDVLAAVTALAPDWPRGLLMGKPRENWDIAARGYGISAVICSVRYLTHRMIGRIKEVGLPLVAYTVNDPRRARALFARGVDGVISDRPDAILADT